MTRQTIFSSTVFRYGDDSAAANVSRVFRFGDDSADENG